MKKRIILTLTISLIISTIFGLLFLRTKYYYFYPLDRLPREISKEMYNDYSERDNNKSRLTKMEDFNFQLVLISFLGSMGIGLLITNLIPINDKSKHRKKGGIKKNDVQEMQLKGSVHSVLYRKGLYLTRYINRPINYMKFDKKGNRVEETIQYTHLIKLSFVYDSNDQIIEEHRHNSSGKLISITYFKYNNLQLRTSMRGVKANQEFSFQCSFQYDENENIIEENWYRANGSIFTKAKINYDYRGNMIEFIVFGEMGTLQTKTVFTNDKYGNILETNEYNRDVLQSIDSYKYDQNNNRIKSQSYNPEGVCIKLTTFEYKYDLMGNWLLKYKTEDGDTELIEEREINYYWYNWIKYIFTLLQLKQ